MEIGDRDDMRVVHPGWEPGQRREDQVRRRPRARWWAGAGLAVAGLALAASLMDRAAQVPATRPVFPGSVYAPAPPPAPPAPAPAIAAWHEDSAQVHPPTAPTAGARVAGPADDARPCGIDDLSLTVGGWDRATGNGSATVTATNMSTTPCLVGGWPTVKVVQERPLSLTVRETSRAGSHAATAPLARVVLPPRAGATSALWWRGHGTAADQRIPQRLALRFVAGDWRTVPFTHPDGRTVTAPFDLVDGGEIELGPWAPVTR